MTIVEYITYQFHHNQFVSAALIASPIAAVMIWIRRSPFILYNRIRNSFSLNVRFNSDQLLYAEAMSYVTEKVVMEKYTKNYIFSSIDRRSHARTNDNGTSFVNEIKSRLIEIGYGTHIGVYRKRLVLVYRKGMEDSNTSGFKEYCTCTFITRSKKIIHSFMDDIEKFTEEKKIASPGVRIKINRALDKWTDYPTLPLRSLDTIFLPNNVAQTLVDHILNFDKNEEYHHQKGIPHHTGIFLKGPPGTGKSSLIHAIASATGRTIFYLNLKIVKDLNDLLSGSIEWRKAMLVIEDIDVSGASLKREDESADVEIEKSKQKAMIASSRHDKVSLSELLNVLDGLMSPDGLVVIATTNHAENLDPALLRPGRFDVNETIGLMGKNEFDRMATLFGFDHKEYTLDIFPPMPGSNARMLLLKGGVKAVEDYQKDQIYLSQKGEHDV